MVPWWLGTMDSRTPEAGRKVGVLRRRIAERLDDPDIAAWLQRAYYLCPHAAHALIDYMRESQVIAGCVPDERRRLVESWRDELGRMNVILHSPFGYRINRTWGIAVDEAAKRRWRQDSITATNDIILLTRREGAVPLQRGPAWARLRRTGPRRGPARAGRRRERDVGDESA